MNSQEREQVTRFLDQLRSAKAGARDSEADALIRDAVASNPDASYLLVQRALLLEQALNAAKARIDELQRASAGDARGDDSGFLGRNPWAIGGGERATGAGVPGAQNYSVPRGSPAMQAAPAYASGGGSSFLGTVASTAAGVVAGSFLFQGIENLLGHHHSGSWSDPSMDQMAGQTTINNYYGSDSAEQWAGAGDTGASDSGDMLVSDDYAPDADSDLDGGFDDDSNWV